MSGFLKGIGSVVITLFMYSVPVTLGYAFADGWNGFWKLLFAVCALVQIIFIASFIAEENK